MGGLLLLGAIFAEPFSQIVRADPNQQDWLHVPGTCDPSVEGAVLSTSTAGCGGSTTTFDVRRVYRPTILRDIASVVQPCGSLGLPSGATCYRMWYVGNDTGGVRRLGHAVSPDGVTWTRVPGAAGKESILGLGPLGSFDSNGASSASVIKDGATFRMWYSGIGADAVIEGIGYATSTDGVNWTRVPGALAGGAVLRASEISGSFDRDEVVAPTVILDRASALLPCEGGRTSGACYRMWYEGVILGGGPVFRIGHAVSPDGLTWTRVPGSTPSGAVVDLGPFGTFDSNSTGVAAVVKDGALYRMWYEAKDFSTPDRFTVGYVVSTDGVNWARPSPNQPVYEGSDDPGTFSPDNVWAPAAIKDGLTYRMWYSISTNNDAVRIGHARLDPGTPIGGLAATHQGGDYTLSFTTAKAIPAGGSVLLTLPPEIPFEHVAAGALSGFGAAATISADPAAISDALARGVTRGALLIRLPIGAVPGPKAIQFSLPAAPAISTELLVQTFGTREVLEQGSFDLLEAVPIVDLEITKTDGSATAIPGTTVTYTIVASNTGEDPVSGAQVLDTFPAVLSGVTWSCAATSGSGCPAGGSGDINATVDLEAGGQATFTASGTIDSAATGVLTNTAAVTPPGGVIDPDTSNNSAVDMDALSPTADLRIGKSSAAASQTPGMPISYTIVVTNTGPSAVTGARVIDTFPPAVSGVSWSCVATSGSSCPAGANGDINVTVDLVVGGRATFVANGTINSAASGALANTASVTVPGGVVDPDTDNNSATVNGTLAPRADLRISKAASSSSPVPGTPIGYTIVVTNTGPSAVTGARVIDTFPAALSGVSWSCVATNGSSCPAGASGDINATVDLAVGGQATFTASGAIDSAAIGALVNNASVTAPGGVVDPDTDNNSATVNGTLAPRADLRIGKTSSTGSPVPGTPIGYTIVVTNTGPSAVTGAQVLDTFPAALSGVSWSCVATSGSSCPAGANGDINATVDLAVGGQATFTATGAIDSAATGILTNTASVTAPGGVVDPIANNNTATAAHRLAPRADLRISKTDGVTSVRAGSTVTYTIVVSNLGPSVVSDARVLDTFPAVMSGVGWTCSATASSRCAMAGGSGNINATVDLAVGGQATFTASGTINGTATGMLTNTASVVAPSGVFDPATSNNSATDTSTLIPSQPPRYRLYLPALVRR
jgi:uncharacterized repeat protein (TIGR01451 family)